MQAPPQYAGTLGVVLKALLLQIKSRVVGIPPGSVMKKGVLYLVKLTSTLGGLVLAILAWVVAAIDQYSLANYGFSPGCTGFILIAGFVTSAMDKVRLHPLPV